jgi:hypothetical protein
MKTKMDYFLEDIKQLTRTRPPFNDAFTFRLLNVLGTAVTVIEGLHTIIEKDKIEKSNPLRLNRPELLQHEKIVEKDRPRKIRGAKDLNREASIVADFKAGMKKRHIAAKHDVTPARISQILERNGHPPKRWERGED